MTDANIENRYNDVQANIQKALEDSGRTDSVTLIAVSKLQSVDDIRKLYELGHRDFGENYVQELVEKAETFRDQGITDIRWHFIGHLQTNKVKQLVPFVTVIQSVDSIKLAQEISKRWKGLHALPIFLNVNIDQEKSKDGVSPLDVHEVCESVSHLPGLHLEGLMCIPAPTSSQQVGSHPFHRLRELEHLCRPFTHGQLSMGMSSDYQAAIREGATHIRVGTSLFGKR
jgi:PLP dependent protein